MIPNLSFSCSRMCASSALRSSALEGMQPDVEADTSPVLLLDHPDLEAELGGADGGDVPTGAGTEDDDIEITHGSEPIPPWPVRPQPGVSAAADVQRWSHALPDRRLLRLPRHPAARAADRAGPRRHSLVRRPPPGPRAHEVQWDPYTAPLGPRGRRRPRRRGQPRRLAHRRQPALEEVGREPDEAAGSPPPGCWPRRSPRATPSRSSWPATRIGDLRRPRQRTRRPRTTRLPRRRPARPRHPRLAGRDRAGPSAPAPGCVILRTSPVYDRRSQPLGALRLQFKAGLGGRLGDGHQYVPMISDARLGRRRDPPRARPTTLRPVQPVLRASADERGAHPRAGPPGAPAGLPARAGVRAAPGRGRDGPRGAELGEHATRPPCWTAASASATPTSGRCCARASPQSLTDRTGRQPSPPVRRKVDRPAYDGRRARQRPRLPRVVHHAPGHAVEDAQREAARSRDRSTRTPNTCVPDPAYDETAGRRRPAAAGRRARRGRARAGRARAASVRRDLAQAPAGGRPRRAARRRPRRRRRRLGRGHRCLREGGAAADHEQDASQTGSTSTERMASTLPSRDRARAVVHRRGGAR